MSLFLIFPCRIDIAIRNGVCRVGLSLAELEDLAQAGSQGRATKVSTRELSLLLSKHRRQNYTSDINDNDSNDNTLAQWGATTVASTMHLAHLAGISTFVTGGIGGVHRHGHVTLDVSADLHALSTIPVVVVSAGIKSILDIGRTLQVLETLGVPTVSYRTNDFPAFFSSSSGITSPWRVESSDEIATAYWAARSLQLDHGMLVAVPSNSSGNSNSDSKNGGNNADADTAAGANVERAIQAALTEADALGISGQAVTPFVLKRVSEESGGDSLRSNIALVERNAEVGADIAISIANQQQAAVSSLPNSNPSSISTRSSTASSSATTNNPPGQRPRRVLVMGGAVLDIMAKPAPPGQALLLGTSNPATCTESDGGVGRNMTEVLGRLGSQPVLFTAIGTNDARGSAMMDRLDMACRGDSAVAAASSSRETVVSVDGASTATYVAILDEKGDLHTACADMDVLNHITAPPDHAFANAHMLVMDANPSVDAMRQAARSAVQAGVAVFLDPTSVAKAIKVAADAALLACCTYASPNLDELGAMTGTILHNIDNVPVRDNPQVQQAAIHLLRQMNPQGAHLVITCGAQGVVLASMTSTSSRQAVFEHFVAPSNVAVGNATGAGDTLSGAFVHALVNGKSLSEAVSFGIHAATISLQCADKAISPELSNYTLSP
jgi:pseudouridine-5'-phosphate glycosidase/sugar/nucleoside kinase (ribokinase family)